MKNKSMPKIISAYVNFVDTVCTKVGRFVMYGVFFMMFVLILSFVTRNIINFPMMWIIEMAQFTITAYYLLGGAYSMITDDHVRMDLFYGKLSEKFIFCFNSSFFPKSIVALINFFLNPFAFFIFMFILL